MVWEVDCLTRGSDCSLLGTTRAQTIHTQTQIPKVPIGSQSWPARPLLGDLHQSGSPHSEHPGEKGVPQRLKGQPELTCPFGLNYNLRVSCLKV